MLLLNCTNNQREKQEYHAKSCSCKRGRLGQKKKNVCVGRILTGRKNEYAECLGSKNAKVQQQQKKKKIPEFFFGGYKQFNLGTVQDAVYVFLHIPTLIFVSAPQTLTNVLNSVTF